MSNKTQLQTNNTALDGYIARINAAKETAASLPDAGSGGSGSNIATTEVLVNSQFTRIFTTIYTNNTISAAYYTPASYNFDLGVPNTLSGSALVITSPVADVRVVGATFIHTQVVSDIDGIYAHLYQVN